MARRSTEPGRLVLAFLVATGLSVAVAVVARARPWWQIVLATAALTCAPGLVFVLRRTRRAAALVVAGGVVAAPVSLVTWTATHPVLHLDNAQGQPVDVFVDGVRWGTLAPTAPDTEPPHLRLPYGTHRLAWSEVGAPVGLHEIEVELGALDEHLYAPGPAGCYWLSATAYGAASTHGFEHGPLPFAEFHRLDRVDVWFGDTPRTVTTPRLELGTVRVALQRFAACTELAALGCDPPKRHAFVECARSIDGHAGASDCFTEAVQSCPIAQTAPSAGAAVP